MKSFACWSEKDAREILATEALEGGKGRFLAVHMPIAGFEVGGTAASDMEQHDQAGILRALTSEGLRHAFCVVEGEPGSGKSHLIRWLKVMWPRSSDVVLLIQRADGSIDGALRQLRSRLPAGFTDLLDVLGNIQQIGDRGRWANFLSVLANSLAPGYFGGEKLEDEEWCDERKLRELFATTIVAERWSAPARVLDVLSGKGGARNSELVGFSPSDVLELVLFENRIRNVPIATMNLLRKLKGERERLQRRFGVTEALPVGSDELAELAPETAGIVRALNRRLNHALQFFLGIGKDKLKDLFLELRKRLRTANRRLVLLLEDITSFQGVDNQLIDALVTQSRTREDDDLCDLISVVGITRSFYRDYLSAFGNYRDRITHHVTLGRMGDGQFQDVAMLRGAGAPVELAARYLRAVRAGTSAIDSWSHRVEESSEGDEPVPNQCVLCPHRGRCHSVFGQHDGVGLYPFTARSIDKMFHALQDRAHGGMTLQTPRGLIQGVLAPTLRRPDVLEEGRYPGPEVDNEYLRSSEADNIDDQQRATISALDLPPEEKRRVSRLVTWWGNSADAGKDEGPAAASSFFSVPASVFDVLDVSWPGDARGSGGPVVEDSPKEQVKTPIRRTGSTAPPPPPPPAAAAPPAAGTSPELAPPSTKASPAPARAGRALPLNKRQAQIDAWCPSDKEASSPLAKGAGVPVRLEDHAFWQKELFTVVKELPWHTMDVSPWELDRFVRDTSFVFEGSQQIRAENIVIPRAPWVAQGLRAWIELRDGKSKQAVWADELERRLSRLFRRLGKLVVEEIAQRRLRSTSGGAWPAEQAMTAVLLGRAWLRGATSPDRSLADQWREILSAEEEALSSPKTRTEKWGEALGATNVHQDIRERLLLATRLRVGSGSEADGLTLQDASESARALRSIVDRWDFPEPPQASRKPRDHDAGIVQAFLHLARTIDAVPRKELTRLCSQAKEIEALRHGSSSSDRCSQIRLALDRVEGIDPRVAPMQVDAWRRAEAEWSKLVTSGVIREKEVDDLVQRFIAESEAHQSNDAPPAVQLAWELAIRVDVVEAVVVRLRSGDKAVSEVMQRVKQVIEKAGTSGGGLPSLRSFGVRAANAASSVRTGLEAKDE